MANLVIPRREIWTQQPSLLCDVDPTNQFGINAGFISTANSKQRNIFGGDLLSEVSTGTFSPVVTDQGVVSRWAEVSAGLGRLILVKTGSPNSRNFTFLTRVRYNTTVPTIVARSGSTGATNNLIPLWRNAGAFDMRVGGTDYAAAGTFAAGQFYDIAISSSPTGCVLEVDGATVINGAVAASATIDADLAFGDASGGAALTGGEFDIVYALFSPRSLSKAEINRFRSNPWQIFAPRETRLFVPVSAGGSALNASASGNAQASGAASPAAQIALSAVGVSTASGTAAASGSSNIPLSATGLAVSSGTANPSATITISAAGLAQAAGQAGLNAAVLLAGAGAAQASGNAALTAQLLASAAGSATAIGNAALAAQINAVANGAALAAGTAALAGGAPGALNAAGQAQADGAAVLSVSVNLVATGNAVAAGSAAGMASAPGAVSAAGEALASGNASWSVLTTLTAAGFVQAMGAGAFIVEVPLSASGQATAAGSAAGQLLGEVRNFRLAATARRLTTLHHEVRRA